MQPAPAYMTTFVDDTLVKLYEEEPSLIGAREDTNTPRSTERAIVGRMAMHAQALLPPGFPAGSVIDVEYERIGPGERAKDRNGVKISPDLICHERGNIAGNHLVVEVKRHGHKQVRAWPGGPELADLIKITYLTHGLIHRRDDPMPNYSWGLCLELDREGADLWWVTSAAGWRYPAQDAADQGSAPPTVPAQFVSHHRWDVKTGRSRP